MTNKELLQLTREMAVCGVHQSLEHVARALPASVAVEAKVARMAVLDLLQAVRERG